MHEGGQGAEPATYVSLLVPGAEVDAPPLLLLHGSNGDERDLIGLAGEIAPGSSRLAVRGDVAMDPGFAFFHRLPDRRIDVGDLRPRAARLARFVRDAARHDGVHRTPIALGYSNGAVMAAALLLDEPDTLAGAILLRPLLPFEPLPGRGAIGKPVLVIDGFADPRRAPEDGPLVVAALRRAGAVVQHETSRSGHLLGSDDVQIARAWIDGLQPSPLRLR